MISKSGGMVRNSPISELLMLDVYKLKLDEQFRSLEIDCYVFEGTNLISVPGQVIKNRQHKLYLLVNW